MTTNHPPTDYSASRDTTKESSRIVSVGKRVRAVLEVVSIVAMIGASLSVVWALSTKAPGRPSVVEPLELPGAPVSVVAAPQKGSDQAPIVMVIYSDFQCPYCKTFALDTLPEISRLYVDTGKLRLAFRNLPLDAIHPLARGAAVAGLCANRQTRFWEVHDAIFRASSIDETALRIVAQNAKLDLAQFDGCVKNPESAKQLDQEIADATTWKIRGTPTFVIGRSRADGGVVAAQIFSGVRPLASFRAVLDGLLNGPS